MNCPQCNNEVFPGEAFCDNCGADLRSLQTPVVQPTPPVEAAPPPIPVTPPPPVEVVPPPAPPAPPAPPPAPVVEATIAPVEVSPPVYVPPPAPVQPPPPPAPAGGPHLVIKESGANLPLPRGKEIIVGRTDPIDGIFPDIDLTAHDPMTGVSRRHAAIHEQGGQWFIRDLNSTNYTVVNRQRVAVGQDYLIEPGDEIRFGRVVAVFQVI
jgi:hypothetical protein